MKEKTFFLWPKSRIFIIYMALLGHMITAEENIMIILVTQKTYKSRAHRTIRQFLLQALNRVKFKSYLVDVILILYVLLALGVSTYSKWTNSK